MLRARVALHSQTPMRQLTAVCNSVPEDPVCFSGSAGAGHVRGGPQTKLINY